MSVDYNELYQEFILLTSSPSVSSSSPVPSPSPPLLLLPSEDSSKDCSSDPVMNSIHRLGESGSPSDQSLSPHMTCASTSSVVTQATFSNHHPQYMWSQQQLQHFGEKRKDVSPSATSPCSPTEPPAKKQAFKDGDANNNNNSSLCGELSKPNPGALEPTLTSALPVSISTGCIVSNINNSMVQDNPNTAHFPRVNQILSDEDEGTSCIIIHKQGPPPNELRRLLTAPVGQGSRSSSYAETPQSSSYMQHSSNYLSTYTTSTNGSSLQSLTQGGQECWMQHHSQSQMHQQDMPGPNSTQQNMCIVQSTGEAIEEVVKFNPWLANAEAPVFPGGLEVLWKEVPEEYQKLITPQDVPDSARFRGYFTVCELLALKRNLKSRYNSPGGLPPVRMLPPSASAVAAAAAAALAVEIMNAGVGVAVKEALDVLEEEQQQQSVNSTGGGSDTNHLSTSNSSIIQQSEGNHAGGSDSKMYLNVSPEIKHVVPPPPYRTSTLVLKLLQIGTYSIRSFSESNPNRLKVLYNSQRLTYECHLPYVQNRDSSQFQRRILTIDVCFDQIVDIKFGCNKMTLQVDGTPVFTVSHNLANEVPHALTLTPDDQNLLEQIDKGLLKLTPIHQLYFINERLVHNLESQLREHPRFRHLLTQNQMSLHGR